MHRLQTHKATYLSVHHVAFITGRMPQSGKLPVYPQAKNQVFAPHGRLIAPIQVKLGRADEHVDPLGCAKLRLNRQGGGNAAQNIKNFHFLVKSHSVGATPLTDFENFRGFYMPNYPTLVFQISCDSHHRLRSYCGETARRKLGPIFPCTL